MIKRNTAPAAAYRTILVDPPWDTQQQSVLGAVRHYPLLSPSRIKAMPVNTFAAADAHVWLWVTNATLRIGYDVMKAWGSVLRSPLTWIELRFGLGIPGFPVPSVRARYATRCRP